MVPGLTPYAQSAFNAARFPLKTLEYLAAGCPAVVSDLPAHRCFGAPHVVIADTPASFAADSWAARAAEVAALIGLDDTAPRSRGRRDA